MGSKYSIERTSGQRYKANDRSSSVVHYANFSERWYTDAKREAAATEGHHSKRREIIAAASFLETYIFEWARSLAIDRIEEYFPPMPRFQIDPRFKRSLSNKWKQIPAELYADRIIPVYPKLKLLPLGTLVKLRYRLLYSPMKRRLAALRELESVAHGWALDVARRLVLDLHEQLGNEAPRYL